MCKYKFYNAIKKTMYRKFNELDVVERNDGDDLYLHYKDEEYAQILIEKKSGHIYYFYGLSAKFFKIIRIGMTDFEVLLSTWVEDTFQTKVNHIYVYGRT